MILKSALLCSVLAAAPLVLGGERAEAAAIRTFVSSRGNDAGNCGSAAPCRTFAFALARTATGGELAVIDTGEYGPATITQAVSIVNAGGVAVIQANSGNAITINAGPYDLVSLRGLDIHGAAGSNAGIVFNKGGRLEVVDCVVRQFTNNGILISPSSAASFSLLNTSSSDNGGDGIGVQSEHGLPVKGVMNGVTASGNHGYGIILESAGQSISPILIDVSVSNSVADNNVSTGFFATGPANTGSPNGGAALVLRDVSARYNGVGAGEISAAVILSRSTLAGNGVGANIPGNTFGQVVTTGENMIYDNGVDVSGTLTIGVGSIH